jgi:hypothetical protein
MVASFVPGGVAAFAGVKMVLAGCAYPKLVALGKADAFADGFIGF